MAQYPYTIENGSGERLTFTGIVHGPDGDRVEADGFATPGAGPPMHVHILQEEAARVVAGRMGYQLAGREPQFAGPGELVVWPAGTAHRWWNAGDTELHMSGWCKPPGNVEFFLSSIFASMKATGKNRPAIFDAAFLITRYRSEFGMPAIPAPVQRVVFPIAIAIGRLLGKYHKYAGAPPPMSR